jgi:hypothetical protein
MSWRHVIVLLALGVSLMTITPADLLAEEIGIHYQILGSQPGNGSTTTTFILEFLNLAGNEISDLTVSLENPSSPLSDPGAIKIGILGTTDSRMVMASFIVSDETLLTHPELIRFHLQYETADGIPRATVLQGEPTIFIGNPTP